MRKAETPQSFIEPSASKEIGRAPLWTVETVAHASQRASTSWGDPYVGPCVTYLYANLSTEDLIGLLQEIREISEEHTLTVYRQDSVRKADWVEQWLSAEIE